MEHYLKLCFEELSHQDGLLVLGKGLGINLLFTKFVQYFSLRGTGRTVFCINANGYEKAIINLLIAEQCPPEQLPKIITNEVSSQERSDMYTEGGCFFITSRILIVDLLDNKVNTESIAGFLVYNAHRISEVSIESFIMRVFRERNRNGFIKAFSEDPESLQSGFARVERLLRLLYVTKLYLWPRFRIEVAKLLEANEPEVIELSLPLTIQMKAIQGAILVAMKACITELKKGCSQLDTTQLTLENGLFSNFDYYIRSQLDPDWHRIPYRTKQIVTDLGVLRKLLDYLIRYDSFSFYYLLLKLKSNSNEQRSQSLWLTSEAADQIFRRAKERVYRVDKITSNHKKSYASAEAKSFALKAQKLLQLEYCISPVLESPPKWQLLVDVVKEIKEDYSQKYNHSSSYVEANVKEDISEKRKHLSKVHNNRILLILRDDLALSQLRDVLTRGEKSVMEKRYRWFITQQAGSIRNRSKKATKFSDQRGSSSGTNPTDSSDSMSQGIAQRLSEGIAELHSNKDTDSSMDNNSYKSSHGYKGNSYNQSNTDSEEWSALRLGLMEKELKSMPLENQLLVIENQVLRLSEGSIRADYYNPVGTKRVLETKKNSEDHSAEDIDNLTSYYTEKDAKSSKRKKLNIGLSVDSQCGDDIDDTLRASILDPEINLQMMTHEQFKQNFTALSDIKPSYIILYDPDISIVRSLETFQATVTSPLRVYFLLYNGSAEEHRYVGALAKEKKAFESLIATKEHMVISLPDNPNDIIQEKNNDLLLSNDTRVTKKELLSQQLLRKIVVDVREFRSTLPSLLHAGRFSVIPRTLTVGDYILSPEICVERKGISDLFQSFASGRLYNQAESMSKYYKLPCLLIEFNPDKSFTLMPVSEITPDIQQSAITSKLVLLAMSFPNLYFLWSRSAAHTTEIFKSIVTNHSEVEVEKAVSAGGINDVSDGIAAYDRDENQEDEYGTEGDNQTTSRELLLSLPGINTHNFRNVMNNVESVSALSKLSEAELAPLIGPGNAKELYKFFTMQL